MPNEITADDLQHAAVLNARSTVAAALVTTDNLNPANVDMHDEESMQAYAAKLSDTIDLVMRGVNS